MSQYTNIKRRVTATFSFFDKKIGFDAKVSGWMDHYLSVYMTLSVRRINM